MYVHTTYVNTDNPGAKAQLMPRSRFLETIPHSKETTFLEEMANFRAIARKVQSEPGTFACT